MKFGISRFGILVAIKGGSVQNERIEGQSEYLK